MFLFHWLSSLKHKLRAPYPSNIKTHRKQNHRSHAQFAQTSVSRNVAETLEDRTLLTAFTVVNTNDSGTGSLREAIELANANAGADTISFDAGLAGQSIVLTDELEITDDLTITGLGSDQLTLDGNNNSRIFNISDYNSQVLLSVMINRLTLTNGYESDGGAIFNEENLTMTDCTFSNNEALFSGGAIRNQSDLHLTIDNCIFSKNTASSGGGIFGIRGLLTVLNTTFSENTADSRGGGINGFDNLTIDNSIFSGNKATWFGGSIFNDWHALIVIDNSEFSNNSARQGGGIYNTDAPFTTNFNLLTITDSTFSNNITTGNGGAICNIDSILNVINSTFVENSAGSRGGGIHHQDIQLTHQDIQLKIDNSFFSRNSAGYAGGAVSSSGDDTDVITIINSTFTENSATSSGGAIVNSRSTISIMNSSITNNFAMSDGGGIYIVSDEFTIINSTLSGNTSSGNGGGIYYSWYSLNPSFTVLNSTIVGNTSAASGGGIFSRYIIHNTIFNFTYTITNSLIAGNIADSYPQIYQNFIGNFNTIIHDSIDGLIDPVLRDNGGPTKTHALLFGSAAIDAGDNTEVTNAGLITDQRGAGFARIVEGTVDIGAFETNALHFFVDTNSDLDDGDYSVGQLSLREAIKLANAFPTSDTITFATSLTDQTIILESELVISDNLTIIGLGADQLTISGNNNSRIFKVDDGNTDTTIHVEISGLSLTNGYDQNGGAIFSKEILSVIDSMITDNTAMNFSGGGIYSLNTLTIDNTTFLRNFAQSYGGAIFNNSTTLTVTNSLFSENEAKNSDGGGIFDLNSTLSILDSTFSQNKAISGAGISHRAGMLNIEGSTFTKNEADFGGGIYHRTGPLTITDSFFLENKVSSSGGGIHTFNSKFTVSNTKFSENTASRGAGVYNSLHPSLPLDEPTTDLTMAISDSTFSKNSASDGGGIYYKTSSFGESGIASVLNSTFTENRVTGDGGGIYFEYGQALVLNSILAGNSADRTGGGISNFGTTLMIKNSTLTHNSAIIFGGGISNGRSASTVGGNISIINSTLSENSAIDESDNIFNYGYGGGIHNNYGSVSINNSTLSGNIATKNGGAIFSQYGSPLNIISSTLTGNTANFAAGIYSLSSPGDNIINSIIAGNLTNNGSSNNFGNFFNTNSIIQDSIEGLLDTVLRDHGGPTKTHVLLPGSAAINAGDNTTAAGLTNDQRGAGFDRIIDGTIDIGAYEVQTPFTQIDLRIVKSKTSTQSNGEASSLPENQTWIDEWNGYWLEIWISAPSTADLGILSANLNFTYNTEITTATSIEYGAAFTVNQTGTINDVAGTIKNLSAATSQADVGDDQHVLFARIRFESINDDSIDLDLQGQSLNSQSPDFSIGQPEVIFVGGSPSKEIHGPSPDTQIWANPYDLNDDDAINFRDLILFASVYNTIPSESSSDYSWFADLNQSNSVNFRDLIFFASNYGKSKLAYSTIVYPQNFPDAWNNQLLVNTTQGEPQLAPAPLSQSAADQVLDSVVEHVSPQLTPSQNETLENIDIQVVDLEGDTLGRAVSGTIYIDVNAAGYGWFVDDTPGDHSEFDHANQLSLIALPDTDAAGRLDLWSVIMHELGHILGSDHEEAGLMQDTLTPGTRKLPSWEWNIDLENNSMPEEADSFFLTIQDETELVPF